MNTTVEHDQTNTVNNTFTETIKSNTSITVSEGNYNHDVKTGTATCHVKGVMKETYDATQETTVDSNITIKSTKGNINVKSVAGEMLLDAATKITLHTGDSLITMESNGTITISGKSIKVIGSVDITESAPKIAILGGDEAKIGVGNQNMTCDKTKTAVSGAAINSSAVGMHEITGGLVKIN
jgi:type VI secretion system secreted protein VgrG